MCFQHITDYNRYTKFLIYVSQLKYNFCDTIYKAKILMFHTAMGTTLQLK